MFITIPRHLLVAAAAWLGRIVIALTQIASIPLLIRSLGTSDYAVFAVLLSLLGWYLLADLGLGLSLQNFISERRSANEPYADLVVTTALLTIPMALVGGTLLYFAADWLAASIFPLAPRAPGFPLFMGGLVFLLSALGSIAYRILFAEYRGYWANLLPAVAALMGLASLFFLDYPHPDDRLVWALVGFNGPAAFLSLASLLLLAYRAVRADGRFRTSVLPALFRRGGSFWVFAILSAATLQIDYLVIARLMGPQEILTYNISTKVMNFMAFFYIAIIQALWPVCAEAAAKKQWSQLEMHFHRSLVIGAVIVLLGATAFWAYSDLVFSILSPGTVISLSPGLLILLTVYALIRVWSDGYAMLVQSMSRMKVFLIYVPVQAALSALGQFLLGAKFGLEGIVMGLIASFVLTSVWILPREYSRAKAG